MPLLSAVAWPIGSPPPSMRIAVVSASAVSLISVLLPRSITDVAGTIPSTVIVAGTLSTLLGLCAIMLTIVPSGNGMSGVKD